MKNAPLPASSTLKRYTYAVAAAALATLARLALEREVGYRHPYSSFYIAVLCSAWYGGLFPGMLTMLLGAAAAVAMAIPQSLEGFEFYFIVSVTGIILFEAQRRAQRGAQKAEDTLRLAFEHAPVGLCRVDAAGQVAEVNPRVCTITGYAREELLGRDFRNLLYSAGGEPGADLYDRLWRGELPHYSQEKPYLRKDGAAIWIGLTVTLAPPAGGRPYAIAAVQDISRRKEAEEQMRQMHNLESIGLLAGGIAQDFNNLLTGVLGNANLALTSVPADSPARLMLDSIVSAGNRAAVLTGQLLAYAGKGVFVKGRVNLAEVVRDSAEIVRHSVPANVELRVEIHGELPALRGDASQIQQLVTDLAVNGAEAIGVDRTGQVTISAGELHIGDGDVLPKPEVGEVRSGRYLLLRVQDNGEGIDEAILRRIFDPFFSTKFTGRGLGLAAAAGIVRSQRGAILVSATPGHGATFSVLFPVEADSAVANGNPDAEARGALPGRPR